jgi:hypothetical protein
VVTVTGLDIGPTEALLTIVAGVLTHGVGLTSVVEGVLDMMYVKLDEVGVLNGVVLGTIVVVKIQPLYSGDGGI